MDPTVLAQIHNERARPRDPMTIPSPSARVDRLQEGKGGKCKTWTEGTSSQPVDGHLNQEKVRARITVVLRLPLSFARVLKKH